MRFLALPALLFFAASLPKGHIIDKVACSADPRQSYALYLPSNYSPGRAWPILYCLEPLARGRLPVERFEAGAEQYGYIVAGSCNSRNGPPAVALEAIRAMWRDTHETLSIDDKRVYLAGMSGGARVATTLLGTGAFAGVIAQAAGFSGSGPPKGFAFPFFGTAGTDDFNYIEMRQADRELDARGTPHRLVIFVGPHAWAPSPVCASALAWLDLVAMRVGTKPLDKALIHALFTKDIDAARSSEAADDAIAAHLQCRSLVADFKGWEDTAPFEKKSAEIRESKEYRRALKAEERAAARQRELLAKIFSLHRDFEDPDRHQPAVSSLRETIKDLISQAAAPQDSDDRRVARRVVRESVVRAWEESSVQQAKKDYAAAATSLELASLIEPENAELLYNLAGLCALSKDKARAMSYLKKAVEKGFRDRARLDADPSFESLRDKPEFRALVGQVGK
jgi:tetratricopeptide (TPR) repeat protein